MLWYCHALPHGLGAGRPLRGNFGSGKVGRPLAWLHNLLKISPQHILISLLQENPTCARMLPTLLVTDRCVFFWRLFSTTGRRPARGNVALLGARGIRSTRSRVRSGGGNQRFGGKRASPRAQVPGE